MQGIIYILKSSIAGLYKIGQCEVNRFEKKVGELEGNGYKNVSGLKRFYAVKVKDYKKVEKLIHKILDKSRVSDTELFAFPDRGTTIETIVELLEIISIEKIYPPENASQKSSSVVHKIPEAGNNAQARNKGFQGFSAYGIKLGEELTFTRDPSIKVKVISEKEVEYQGKTYSLSGLAKDLLHSKAVQGPMFFSYKGKRISNFYS